jgi:hypothetical protein
MNENNQINGMNANSHYSQLPYDGNDYTDKEVKYIIIVCILHFTDIYYIK